MKTGCLAQPVFSMLSTSMLKHRDGFTVVELLVTIVVSGVIISAIFALFMTIQGTQRSAILMSSATRAGEAKIESLRNLTYTSLPLGETDFTSELPSNLRGAKGTLIVTDKEAGIRRVDITITYKDSSKERRVELSSLIGRLGIGQ